jgi:hypothetical protein
MRMPPQNPPSFWRAADVSSIPIARSITHVYSPEDPLQNVPNT